MAFDTGDTGSILQELPEALVITTLQGEIAFANLALTELTGFQSGDLIGENVSKLLPTPERRRVQVIEWFARWADDPNPDQLRYLNLELVTRSGETRLVSVRVSRHEQQGETWFLVVLRDVTSQHETVAALRHAQLVTNRILAIGEDAVLSIGDDQRITYWNPTAEKVFGYTEAEILGQPLSKLLPPDVADRHDALAKEFSESNEASRLMGERGEITGIHKSGRAIPLEASITKTTIDGVTVLSAQIRDITKRKLAERALRESEARFRAVFENALEAMALLTPDGEVLEINAAARELLPDFNASIMFWELDWWPGQPDAHHLQQSKDTLKQNVLRCATGEVIRTRTTLEQPDGDVEVDFSLLPVKAQDQVVYIVAEGRVLSSPE
jgi:PAS domain S-box-containing protein